jgi:dihydroxyacetone kinase-like predicted kinase
MNEIFKSLGVDYIIEGGQTMNPSTADVLDAVDKVNAKTIFVLPNNKNIILAANQAAELTTDKDLLVIPTKTVPQGICAAGRGVYPRGQCNNRLGQRGSRQ